MDLSKCQEERCTGNPLGNLQSIVRTKVVLAFISGSPEEVRTEVGTWELSRTS